MKIAVQVAGLAPVLGDRLIERTVGAAARALRARQLGKRRLVRDVLADATRPEQDGADKS